MTDDGADRISSLAAHDNRILGHDEKSRLGGGSGGGGMDERITRLEVQIEFMRRDQDNIIDALRVLPHLATRQDIDRWRWQWIATGATIIALILGGMSFLALSLDRPTTAAPVASSPSTDATPDAPAPAEKQ